MTIIALCGRSTIATLVLHSLLRVCSVVPLNIPKNRHHLIGAGGRPMPTTTIFSNSFGFHQQQPSHHHYNKHKQRYQKRTRLSLHNNNRIDENSSARVVDPQNRSDRDNGKKKAKTKNKNTKPTTDRKKVYRPGFNSYLKVVLDDISLENLHKGALHFRDQAQRIEAKKLKGEDTSPSSPTTAKRQQRINKKKFTFKPRSLPSLHMTLFFGGETLCTLPREELVKWHTEITTRLLKSNFVLNISDKPALCDKKITSTENSTADNHAPVPSSTATTKNVEHYNNDHDDFTFTLRGFRLFPPRRNNLIVAVLDASSKWYELHDDLREIASESSSEMLREIAKRSKPRWTAHITLGNIYGGSKQDVQELEEVLQTYLHHNQFLNAATKLTTTIQPEQETANEDNSVVVNDHDALTLTTRSDLSVTNCNRSRQATCIVDRTIATIPFQVEKISMGGPIPNQVELDWDYYLLKRTDDR